MVLAGQSKIPQLIGMAVQRAGSHLVQQGLSDKVTHRINQRDVGLLALAQLFTQSSGELQAASATAHYYDPLHDHAFY